MKPYGRTLWSCILFRNKLEQYSLYASLVYLNLLCAAFIRLQEIRSVGVFLQLFKREYRVFTRGQATQTEVTARIRRTALIKIKPRTVLAHWNVNDRCIRHRLA